MKTQKAYLLKSLSKQLIGTGKYTIYNIDFTSYVNNDILSLVIKSTLKEGSTAQRIIVQTYNYDIKKDKLLSFKDLVKVKGLEEDVVQNKIDTEISKIIEEKKAISTDEYNLYERTSGDKIYKVENITNFFLDKDNYLYVVYAYGNSNFTSEMDIIIF